MYCNDLFGQPKNAILHFCTQTNLDIYFNTFVFYGHSATYYAKDQLGYGALLGPIIAFSKINNNNVYVFYSLSGFQLSKYSLSRYIDEK